MRVKEIQYRDQGLNVIAAHSSSSIRKFKQWQDAEYIVKDVQTAIMRLPVDLKYEERRALASE
jgi:hypothetical protein